MTGQEASTWSPDDGPIQLGSMLFTLIEPHRGFEVAYNRWYERDHFYGGCMVGPYNFAGRRWVATRELKKLRYPASSPITPEPTTGSYLSTYWVEAGHHEDWNRWAYREFKNLHEDGRMFAERDHVHTLLYTHDWALYRDADPVPAALALDHPFRSLVVLVADAAEGMPGPLALGRLRDEVLTPFLKDSPAASCLGFSPQPLEVEAKDVAKSEATDRRLLAMFMLDEDLPRSWQGSFDSLGSLIDASGVASTLWVAPFVPTIPGTDTYTDDLW